MKNQILHKVILQKYIFKIALVLSLAISWSNYAYATKHQEIQNGVEAFLLNLLDTDEGDTNTNVKIVTIDNRINIPECASGFQYHISDEALQQSYMTVRVSCGNNDWYLFTSAQVTRTKSIVVTSGAISPGTVLTADNLTFADVDVRRLRHTAFTSIDTLIGARMKRRTTDGQAIQSNMLCFVCKGDRITISAKLSGMAVKTSGIAQQDGVIGDNIKVVNTSSQKAIIAEVASSQEVVIHL